MIGYSAITGASTGRSSSAGSFRVSCWDPFRLLVLVYVYRQKIPRMGAFGVRVVFKRTRSAGWALGMPIVILGGFTRHLHPDRSLRRFGGLRRLRCPFHLSRDELQEAFRGGHRIGVDHGEDHDHHRLLGVFVWLLTVGGVPDTVNAWVKGAGASQFMVLLLINIVFLIAGMFLEPNSTLVVLTPLFYPIAVGLGVDPIHLGIILVLNISIGMYTPPFGSTSSLAWASSTHRCGRSLRG